MNIIIIIIYEAYALRVGATQRARGPTANRTRYTYIIPIIHIYSYIKRDSKVYMAAWPTNVVGEINNNEKKKEENVCIYIIYKDR